jgi:6-phosphofructokinase 1
MKRIAVLTRDCAGVNAAIRAVVRTACLYGIEVLGVKRGYKGLIEGEFTPLDHRSVSGIVNKGGTILKTTRCPEFLEKEAQKRAVRNIEEARVEGLVVIGGDGSLRGAHLLATRYNIPVVGIPATIDNDVNGVDFAIGVDTGVNVALDALDKIRDTATSLERIFVVEVMGRDCGYIAIQVALAGGCEEVLVPERRFDIGKMCDEIFRGNVKGKISWIIIVAEGAAKAEDIANKIKEVTHLETRIVVLGHIQRGGSPTAKDRVMGARLGNFAVKLLMEGHSGKLANIKNEELVALPLKVVEEAKQIEVESYYRLIKILT